MWIIKLPKTEEEKLELIKARFENIEEDDLMDGQKYFEELNELDTEEDWAQKKQSNVTA